MTPENTNANADFSAILNDTAEEFKQAKVFNDWMPDDGEYTCVLSDLVTGVKDDQNNRFAWWRLTATIQSASDPDIDQSQFSLFYSTKAPGFLKSDVSALAGKTITDIRTADQILRDNLGAIVNVKVSTSPKGYKNTAITEVLEGPDSGKT